MLRPLSNQKTWDAFYSGDPAIAPLPDDASDEQKQERERLVKHALQSGDWSQVDPRAEATRFSFRQLKADEFGELRSMLFNGEKPYSVYRLAFQLALKDAKPLPEKVTVKFVSHSTLGKVATLSFLDDARIPPEVGADVVFELGKLVYERAREPDPLS
jgi:hypothetical protein